MTTHQTRPASFTAEQPVLCVKAMTHDDRKHDKWGHLSKMCNPDMKANLFKKYGITAADLLGSGMEAAVYAYGRDNVLKIYNGMSSLNKQQTLKRFYASIQSGNVSFRFPAINEIAEEDGVVVTIEQRIPGENMQQRLARLNDEQTNAFMQTYLSAIIEMQQVRLEPKFEGCKLFNDYSIPEDQLKDWHGLLTQYLDRKNSEVKRYLSRDVVDYHKKLDLLLELLSSAYEGEYSLIHGDFFPGNLLVNDQGQITGIIDFGLMTMYGDYLFNVATGWVLLDMYDELKANLLERCLNLIITTLGEEIRPKLYLYVLVYSMISANFYSNDCSDGHYQWCVRNMNHTAYWDVLT